MSIPYFHTIQLTIKDATRRRYSKANAKEVTIECRERIVARIVSVGCYMLFVWSKIMRCGLCIIPIERRNREEGRYLNRHFYTCCVRLYSPVICVIAVITTNDDFIS